jgi:hypothetical protein
MKRLTPAERLIVAADFKPTAPNGRMWVENQVLALAKSLKGTGVYLKVNSALRAFGYRLIDETSTNSVFRFSPTSSFTTSARRSRPMAYFCAKRNRNS